MLMGVFPTGKLVDVSVPGSIRETVLLPALVTQTASPPTTTPLGRKPTLMSLPKRGPFVSGLISVTLLSDAFATQTDPSPYAMADGLFPASKCAMTCRDLGSIRERLESPKTIQTEPAPTAMLPSFSGAFVVNGARIVCMPLYCGAIRDTVPRSP